MKPQPRYQRGDRIANRYLVHQALMGGMGEVYLCLDLEQSIPLALKTFQQRYLTDPHRLREAFEQEVATWVALEKHPNIVRCFYMTTLDNQPFMMLEWVAGQEDRGTDLRSWLRHGPLDLKFALEVTIDLCHGLHHAQAKRPGLVHRDLKPENILIARGGLAKITDFGLAEIAKTAGLEMNVAQTSDGRQSFIGGKGIVGTPAYMAPEQWRGEALDVRTDIYAVGVMLYEMIIGRCPFQVGLKPTTSANFQAWLSAMQTAHERGHLPDLPAELPATLNDLLHHCLAKSLSARPTDLTDLVRGLTNLYDEHIGDALPIRPAPGTFSVSDYLNRGNTYHLLGQYQAALADFDRGLELDPTNATAYYNRGYTYNSLGQHRLALAEYSRAIAIDPTFTKAYSNRGSTYAALREHAAALADYDRAIALDPTDAQAYFNRGVTYEALRQYAAALADYSRTIGLDPTHAQAYFNRGNIYADLGEHAAAVADYSGAIELNSTYVRAYGNRGISYNTLGQHEAALADFGRVLALDPNDVRAYFYMGALLAYRGQFRQALPYIEKAAQLGLPEGPQAVAQVRQMLRMVLAFPSDPTQQAFEAFLQARSDDEMRQMIKRYPLLVQADFISAIERIITQQAPPEHRPTLEQRLAGLRQIANTQHPRSTP